MKFKKSTQCTAFRSFLIHSDEISSECFSVFLSLLFTLKKKRNWFKIIVQMTTICYRDWINCALFNFERIVERNSCHGAVIYLNDLCDFIQLLLVFTAKIINLALECRWAILSFACSCASNICTDALNMNAVYLFLFNYLWLLPCKPTNFLPELNSIAYDRVHFFLFYFVTSYKELVNLYTWSYLSICRVSLNADNKF